MAGIGLLFDMGGLMDIWHDKLRDILIVVDCSARSMVGQDG